MRAFNLRSIEVLGKDRPNSSPPRGPELTRQFPPHTGREHIDGGGDGGRGRTERRRRRKRKGRRESRGKRRPSKSGVIG